MADLYVLDENGEPRREPDVRAWAGWFANARPERQVAETMLFDDEVRVSTVFMGMDLGFGETAPVLWQTMIDCGPVDGRVWRYTSRADAVSGHQFAVLRAIVAQGCVMHAIDQVIEDSLPGASP